jgi:hypothetical protein
VVLICAWRRFFNGVDCPAVHVRLIEVGTKSRFRLLFDRTLRSSCSDPSRRENVIKKTILVSALAAVALLWGVAFASAQQLGTDVRALKIKDDPLGQRIFAQVKDGTVATVSYNSPKPGTTDPAPKESYITRVGNQGCGVGYYK